MTLGPPPNPNRAKHPYTGTILFSGLPRINVENVRGSTRSGTDADGVVWSVRMPAHYGEFARTEGADGDPVDVFVGEAGEAAPKAYVIHLQDPKNGTYDEDKVFLGFRNLESVIACFREAYNRRDLKLGPVRVMSVEALATWLQDARKRGRKITGGDLMHKGRSMFSTLISAQGLPIPEWMGEILFSADGLLKGAGHKYLRRVATGNVKRPWRYYYAVTGGAGIGHESEFEVGAKFKIAHDGKVGHFEIVGKDADGKLKIKHDESGGESVVSSMVLRDMLHKEHAAPIKAHREKLQNEIASTSDDTARAKLLKEAGKYSHTKDLAGADGVVTSTVSESKVSDLAPIVRGALHDTAAGTVEKAGHGGWAFTGHNYDPKQTAAEIGREIKARLKRAGIQAAVTTRVGLGTTVRVRLEDAPFHVFRPEYLAAHKEDPHGTWMRFRTRDTQWTPEALAFEKQIGDLASSFGRAQGDSRNGTYIHGVSAEVVWSDTFRSAPKEASGSVPALPVKEVAPVPVPAPAPAPVPAPAIENPVATATHPPVKFTGEVKASKTQKTGADVWSVPHEGLIPKEQWTAMTADAEKVKGYHLRGQGFTFRDPKHAADFVAKWGGGAPIDAPSVLGGHIPIKRLNTDFDPDQPKATPAEAPARPVAVSALARATAGMPKAGKGEDAPPDLARMRSAADTLIGSAKASMSMDRQRNTHRRVRMAASAYASAAADEALGHTLHKIADHIESGNAKHLAKVRTVADVRTLNSVLQSAKAEAGRKAGERYDVNEGRGVIEADIAHARFPHPSAHASNVRDLIEAVKGKAGTANAIRSMETQIRIHAAEGKDYFKLDTRVGREAYEKLLDAAPKTARFNMLREGLASAKRMERLGLEDTVSVQDALREYLGVRTGARAPDPIQAAQDSLVSRKIPGYFPTPKSVQSRMMALADVRSGHTVLEPSAGSGHLADAAKAAGGTVTTVEVNGTLRDILEKKGYKVAGTDALKHTGTYDRVVMNPPFENRQDVDHVMHAFKHNLKPGGRLVSVMGEGPFFGTDAKAREFREWLAANGGTSEKLPDGSFAQGDVRTGVSSRLVTLNKRRT